MDKSKIIPYRYAVIDLDRTAKIYLSGGDIEVGCDLLRKSREETRIRIAANGIWSSNGGARISYGTTIEMLSGAVFETDYFTINSNSVIVSANKICVGKDVMISRNVIIYDSDFHSIFDERDMCLNRDRVVVIENHVWIAANVMVLKGAYIGEGSVVGANMVVKEYVPKNSIIQCTYEKHIRENKGRWDRTKPEKIL